MPDIADALLDRLDRKLEGLVAEIEGSEVYRVVMDSRTSRSLIAAVMRNILFETYSYGPVITEAVATAIGRLATRPDLVVPLLDFLKQEAPHPELALRGFAELGGDEATARSRSPSPAAYAVGAVCLRLARDEDPLSHLGCVYLLEGSTAEIAPRFHDVLVRQGLSAQFVTVHALEDTRHASDVRDLIAQVATTHPGAGAAIEKGFDVFAAVYPHAVWATALERARAEVG